MLPYSQKETPGLNKNLAKIWPNLHVNWMQLNLQLVELVNLVRAFLSGCRVNRKLSEVFSLVCTLGDSNIAITTFHCNFQYLLSCENSLRELDVTFETFFKEVWTGMPQGTSGCKLVCFHETCPRKAPVFCSVYITTVPSFVIPVGALSALSPQRC